jgi:hypothetical protein
MQNQVPEPMPTCDVLVIAVQYRSSVTVLQSFLDRYVKVIDVR